ncbi:hypothetical protein P2W68_05785 [Chryseobacterium arthrosphaerae]|uniref:hypothetical protein n=1 Tax=Chryseobacterium arthrosphaerae TaxID=651561 RepID=UPI0023E24A8C|nr:hypothetical protein [Chryseobacterium arthrosphaerae]WES99126.1 hypothetical protein P2W68_05785 [Chryseobacterium arthrosphaerae]
MSPELRELFEIRQDEEKSRQPSQRNIWKHIIIRLAVIVAGTIVFFIIMSKASGWGAFGFALYMLIFHVLWFLFIFIEAIVLQNNEKYKLRNVNFIFMGILLLLYGIVFALLGL